uniref:Uncharacterized protein LOC114328649 isoform X2 n=1 Tax=Diabrotica virgifera virgifera TaxID=50390 RepID=A0A6P7FCL0_DIAVI
MKFCGTEPRAKRSWSGIIRCWFNILCTLGMIYLAALVFVLEKDLTFVKVTGAIDTIVLMSHCALKMVSIYLQQPIMFELLERKRLHFWDIENSSSKEKKEYRKKVLGYAQFVILFFTVASIIACSSFGLQPLYLRKKVLGVSTYIPQSISFYVLAIYESYALFVVCFGIIPFDISVVYMLCLISVQWKSLNIEIKNILDSKIDTLEDQQLFKAKAIRCVEHHNFLKRPELRELVRRSLYQCNLSNQFILLYAIPAQFLSTETQISEEIVFDTKWYNTACKDKKLFIWMISSVAKREVALKAGKILTVNYEFTFKMYRSIISYYMFLRTMGSNH